jgi:hypothetical protein
LLKESHDSSSNTFPNKKTVALVLVVVVQVGKNKNDRSQRGPVGPHPVQEGANRGKQHLFLIASLVSGLFREKIITPGAELDVGVQFRERAVHFLLPVLNPTGVVDSNHICTENHGTVRRLVGQSEDNPGRPGTE